MITIRNSQRTIPVNTKKLKHDAQKILDHLGYANFDLGIWVTTNATIQKYNRKYRNKDKPTDILSFPFYPQLKAGERIHPKTEDDKNLGDIIISAEFVKKAAKQLKVTFEQHMKVLLVHGICHLLGYDHIKDKDYKVMQKKEKELFKLLK